MTRTYQTAAAALSSSSQGAPPGSARAPMPGGLSLTVATFNITAKSQVHVDLASNVDALSPPTKTCVVCLRFLGWSPAASP